MPKYVDHEVRRDEILHAAFKVISRVGFDGATLRAIAEEAGFTTGVIGYYFRSKEELLEMSLRRSFEAAYRRIDTVRETHSGLQAVRAGIAQVLPTNPEVSLDWSVWLCFLGHSVGADSMVKEHRVRYEEWHRILTELLTDAITTGDIGGHLDPSQGADLLISTLYGIGVQATLNGMLPDQQLQLVDIALKGWASGG